MMQHKPEAPAKVLRWRFRLVQPTHHCRSAVMSMHIALLRGINVGGHNSVAMSDLRDLCGALGLGEATSLLQSGNLVFRSDRLKGGGLEHLLEVETAKRLNVNADYLVRSARELAKIVARNPFPKEARND